MKKSMVIITLMILIAAVCCPMTTQAASHYKEITKSSAKSFKKKWSSTKTWKIEDEDGLYVSMVYGYDTFATNEDYVKSCKGTLGHKAYVKNSNGTPKNTGWYKGSVSANGNPSHKVDVKHTGVSVIYRLYADYE